MFALITYGRTATADVQLLIGSMLGWWQWRTSVNGVVSLPSEYGLGIKRG